MSKIALGQTATYVSHTTGNRKTALVVATGADAREGSSLAESLGKKRVNVVVFNPKTGAQTFRANVPVGEKAFQKALDRAGEVIGENEWGEDIYAEAPSGYLEV